MSDDAGRGDDAAAPSPGASATTSESSSPRSPTPVFFVAGGTGISAEILGNLMLQRFPGVAFRRHKVPFITSTDYAREVAGDIASAAQAGATTLVFSTISDEAIRAELEIVPAAFIDLFGPPLQAVEHALHVGAEHQVGSLHGLGDTRRYDARMKAIEFALEHDDGASLRHLDQADLILVAPSRCGKTPTSIYLALQHGLLVANYPLVDEDFDANALPGAVRDMSTKCFGLLSTAARLAQVRGERRPGSTYATLAQCSYELRRAEALYRSYRIPSINSSSMSVEEMAAVIMQKTGLNNLA